jgi:guanine deaminase
VNREKGIDIARNEVTKPVKYEKIYMDRAFALAFEGVRNGNGGPFGAVIVRDGEIIGRGFNHVISDNDPTAHAEVTAIRDACKRLETFSLEGATIYTTCEPCPMCLSAIYWARISTIFYTSTRLDAENAGFRDNLLYREINLKPEERSIPFLREPHERSEDLFREWNIKEDKTEY